MTNSWQYHKQASPMWIEFNELRNDAIEKAVACPHCKRSVGESCKTSGGNTATWCHVGRVEAWRMFLREKYAEQEAASATDYAAYLLNWLDTRPLSSLEKLVNELRTKLEHKAQEGIQPYRED